MQHSGENLKPRREQADAETEPNSLEIVNDEGKKIEDSAERESNLAETANDNRESHPGGTLGRIVDAVNAALPRSIIFVSGFIENSDYAESVARLAEQNNVTLVQLHGKTHAMSKVRSETERESEKYEHDQEMRIVTDVPHLLRDMLFDSWDSGASVLSERSPDHLDELLNWLPKPEKGENGEMIDAESPLGKFEEAMKTIMELTNTTKRPFTWAMPADSGLALAFFTFIATGTLDADEIIKTRKLYARFDDPIAVLKIEDGVMTAWVGDQEIVSQRI